MRPCSPLRQQGLRPFSYSTKLGLLISGCEKIQHIDCHLKLCALWQSNFVYRCWSMQYEGTVLHNLARCHSRAALASQRPPGHWLCFSPQSVFSSLPPSWSTWWPPRITTLFSSLWATATAAPQSSQSHISERENERNGRKWESKKRKPVKGRKKAGGKERPMVGRRVMYCSI